MAKSPIRTRIPVDNIKPGMILVDDVFTPTGNLLIPALTILTQKHIYRMQLYQILSVVIKGTVDEYEPPVIDAEDVPSVTKELEEFKEFQKSYTECSGMIENSLNNVLNNVCVDVDELYSICTSLFSSMKTKQSLFTYLHNLKSYDDYTFNHCLNVSMLANLFASWLNFKPEELKDLTIAGALHDIGKLNIPLEILNKQGKLTANEFAQIKDHPRVGYEILRDIKLPQSVKLGVLMHHEKYDGSGYPLGVTNDKIHPFGKILAIVDIYDAMTSDRPYHKRMSPFKVIKMYEQEAFGVLDLEYVNVFQKNIAYNYLNSTALLSNGKIGKIIYINPATPSFPLVQVDNDIIDLQKKSDLEILNIL